MPNKIYAIYAERHRPRGVGLAGAVHRTRAVAEKNDWQFSNPRIDTAGRWSRLGMVVGQGPHKQKTLSVTRNMVITTSIRGMVVGEGGRSIGVLGTSTVLTIEISI